MTLEEELQAWGASEAAGVGTPPGFRGPRDRRWWPAVAAAAVVLAVGGGAALLSARESRPVTTPAADVVPWADLPPSPYVGPSPLPRPTVDSSVRHCTAADLAASNTQEPGAATGTRINEIDLTNTSTSPCALVGKVEAITGINSGVRKTIRTTDGSYAEHVPVVLRPGASGGVSVAYYPRCDVSPFAGDSVFRGLRLTLLGGTLEVAGNSLDLGCGADRPAVAVSGIGALATEPVYALDPRAELVASLQVPASVRAGDVLRYTVVLTNPTEMDVALEPCPNLLQTFGATVKQGWSLNCGDAHPVLAGGSEAFAMELRVPADAAGATRLGWYLQIGTGEPVTATVEVV